ncbi:DUF4384 domain-containing protein [Bradyrhizobium sp. JYMT SZCCT0428]|uniref:DUF4384 domain-containing protein n=1 Tax=Bradyrhizobium sp. JYMT SZCCT0428 TaxID=2807673 RepID=UPI001BA934E5|nr:DUF4384 domain-containing protein [Bradyrhizobium sp. JYMT SZCCT0428]MBR1155198.1 DUF4384 domain-containing protein [Bradyrhizobium sp. JYMT SZCCT0428]
MSLPDPLKIAVCCAILNALAQHAVAAVVILDGTASPPPVISPAPEKPSPREQPGANESGMLKQPTTPTTAATPFPPVASTDRLMDASDLNAVKVVNPAEVTLDMMPGQTVSVGSRVSFRISSKKPGYLVLVDVDATGHLTQIYPSTALLARANKQNGNYVRPGGVLTIPLATDPFGSGIEFVVSPPSGEAMIVAILSSQPVQILDLPDVPPEARTQSDVLAFLTKWTSELRIPDESTGQLRGVRWSFKAKPYSIQ